MGRFEFVNAVRRAFAADLTFVGAPERVFPLLCPVAEYDWIESWACDMVYSDSGVAELGCVFRTNRGDGDEVWTVSRYEPGLAIEFVRVIANVRVTKLDIALSPNPDGMTSARVTVTYTALSAPGAAHIEAMAEREQEVWIRGMETMLNHYLTTGTMFRH